MSDEINGGNDTPETNDDVDSTDDEIDGNSDDVNESEGDETDENEVDEADEIKEADELDETDDDEVDEMSEVEEDEEILMDESNEALDATFEGRDYKNKDEMSEIKEDYSDTFSDVGSSVLKPEQKEKFDSMTADCIAYEYANGLQDNPDSVTQHVAKDEAVSKISEHKGDYCSNGRYTDEFKEYANKTKAEAKADSEANSQTLDQGGLSKYDEYKCQINRVLDRDIYNKLDISDYRDRGTNPDLSRRGR